MLENCRLDWSARTVQCLRKVLLIQIPSWHRNEYTPLSTSKSRAGARTRRLVKPSSRPRPLLLRSSTEAASFWKEDIDPRQVRLDAKRSHSRHANRRSSIEERSISLKPPPAGDTDQVIRLTESAVSGWLAVVSVTRRRCKPTPSPPSALATNKTLISHSHLQFAEVTSRRSSKPMSTTKMSLSEAILIQPSPAM